MQPNILFAFADDWGRYASAYRHIEGPNSLNHLIDTPNFDRIAREGALFTNAFVPAPSCTPCRSSILSGQYFWQTGLGAILQGAIWDESIPTYPLELEKAGYHIGYTYKVWSPGKAVNAPYGAERTCYETAGNNYRRFSHWATRHAEELGVEGAKQALLDETRDNFNSFLDARPENTPFCYWWGPTNTHRSWERGSGKALWGLEPDDLKGRLPGFLPDVHDIREDVADYLGECQAVDAGLGVLIQRLEEIGELDNTLIMVTSDNGMPFPRMKGQLYEIAYHMPLAAMWKDAIEPDRIVDDLINFVDFAPTFLEAAGIDIHPQITGKSLLPIFKSSKPGIIDPERTVLIPGKERHDICRPGTVVHAKRGIRDHRHLYLRNFEPDRWPAGDPEVYYRNIDDSPTKTRVVEEKEQGNETYWQLCMGKRPKEELYDIQTDPHCITNLAESADHQTIKNALWQKLRKTLKQHGDPRMEGRGHIFDEYPVTNPEQEQRVKERFRIVRETGILFKSN